MCARASPSPPPMMVRGSTPRLRDHFFPHSSHCTSGHMWWRWLLALLLERINIALRIKVLAPISKFCCVRIKIGRCCHIASSCRNPVPVLSGVIITNTRRICARVHSCIINEIYRWYISVTYLTRPFKCSRSDYAAYLSNYVCLLCFCVAVMLWPLIFEACFTRGVGFSCGTTLPFFYGSSLLFFLS